MAGTYLKEKGIDIEVKGSDKYLALRSPVKLDEETSQTEDLYLFVNSYSFCGMSKKKMIVYDRQSPEMLDKVAGRSQHWIQVRPFLYVSDISLVSKCCFLVTNYERERGPYVNSVMCSLNDGSPFDTSRGSIVKIIPRGLDEVDLPEKNTSMVFFQGQYKMTLDGPMLVLAKGSFFFFSLSQHSW
jgi:hypothetical protein